MLNTPPFCPNPDCIYHHNEQLPGNPRIRWYHNSGHLTTQRNGRIQRYICVRCRRQFSSQTFSLDYRVKKRIPYRQLFHQLNSGSGIRFLARTFGVTDKVIINRIGRLARQSLALHAAVRQHLVLCEDAAADGFESFTVSQYFPNNIHLLVGTGSQYLYGADYAHIRRKGRMREAQKRKRARLEHRFRASPAEITASFTRLMHQFARYYEHTCLRRVRLYTDEKTAYRTVTRNLPLQHITISSRKERTVHNELFPVNYFDRELRKDQGNHVRETVEFSRNVNNCMERLWVYGAYHNYVKPYRVRQTGDARISHAEKAGIPLGVIRREWKTLFTQRRFVSRVHLSVSEWMVWYRCYVTPLKRTAEHVPAYVCA